MFISFKAMFGIYRHLNFVNKGNKKNAYSQTEGNCDGRRDVSDYILMRWCLDQENALCYFRALIKQGVRKH